MKFFDIPPPPPLSTLSAIGANTTSTGTTIDFPEGILQGDLLWLQVGISALDPMHVTGADGLSANPAEGFGFVYDFYYEGMVNRQMFQAKIADGSESDADPLVISSIAGSPSVMKIFRGDYPALGFSRFFGNYTAVTGDPTAMTIPVTGAVAGKPLILFGAAWAGAGNPTVSGTLQSGGVALTSPAAAYKSSFQIQNSSPASRTWDMNDVSEDNALWGVGVSVF